MDKNLNLKPEILKPLEGNIGSTLQDIGISIGKDFLSRTQLPRSSDQQSTTGTSLN